METDPKGQLGGLDATDDVRRRMATESRAWKCQACGKTNEEIIRECEEAAKEHEGEGQTEVEVPSDLKMGWRDEMDKNSSNAAASGSRTQQDEEDAESAELAGGFVQTVPLPPAPQPETAVTSSSSSIPAQPGQGVPQPTRTIPLPAQFNPRPQLMMQHRQPPQVRVSNDEVTFWIDRLIVVLSIALAAMILKVFLA